MSGITVIDGISSGVADFFGGPQKMQEFIRQKVQELQERVKQEISNSSVDYRPFLEDGLSLINGTLTGSVISEQQLLKIVDHFKGCLEIYLEDFVRLHVPEGKTDDDIYSEIQKKLEPDSVANTNFFYLVAVLKALKEMDEFLANK